VGDVMKVCRICNLPEEAKKDCCCPLKIEEFSLKIEEFRERIQEGFHVQKIGKRFKTIIGRERRPLGTKNWRKRAVKELKRGLHINGTSKHGKIILNGNHSKRKIIEILISLALKTTFPDTMFAKI